MGAGTGGAVEMGIMLMIADRGSVVGDASMVDSNGSFR